MTTMPQFLRPFSYNVGRDMAKSAKGTDKSIQYHELLRNSIQNISASRPSGGEIQWCQYRVNGHYKLGQIDNGSGMSLAELKQNIGTMHESGTQSGDTTNRFGIGAKTMGCIYNSEGLLYISWLGQKESRIHILANDKIAGVNDNQQHLGQTFQIEEFDFHLGVYVPLRVRGNGTLVILLGDSVPANTVNQNLSDIICRRFYKLDKAIKIRNLSLHNALIANKGLIVSFKEVMQSQGVSLHFDTVALSQADIDWYILQPNARYGSIKPTGGLAECWEGEIYNTNGLNELRQYGIHAEHKRVVLVVRPHYAEANSSRVRLYDKGGRGLPHTAWGEEFIKVMPDKLMELMGEPDDIAQDLPKSTQKLIELMMRFQHKFPPNNPTQVTGAQRVWALSTGQLPKSAPTPSQPPSQAPNRNKKPKKPKKPLKVKKKIPATSLPKVSFVSETKNQLLKGNIGSYERTGHIVQINIDSSWYNQLLDYPKKPRPIVQSIAREVISMHIKGSLTLTIGHLGDHVRDMLTNSDNFNVVISGMAIPISDKIRAGLK